MFSPSLLLQHINHAKELGYTEDKMYIRVSKIASDYILESVSFVTNNSPRWLEKFFWIPCESHGIDNEFIILLCHTELWTLFWYIAHKNFINK